MIERWSTITKVILHLTWPQIEQIKKVLELEILVDSYELFLLTLFTI